MPKLKSSKYVDFNSLDDTADFVNGLADSQSKGLNMSALYHYLSLLIWGLIMLKAKAGIIASGSKDSAAVEGSWNKIIKMVAIVGLVSFAQMRCDTSSSQVVSQYGGRNLQAQNSYDF